MSVQFNDTETSLVAALRKTTAALQGDTLTLRELLQLVGEQGLLLFCGILTLPFLLPVSIPGISTVFGLVIILIGIGVTLNRVPWLPQRLMNQPIERARLVAVFEQGIKIFSRLEQWVKPRQERLTSGQVVNRINGLMLIVGGGLLLFPLGLIPFSNTLPAFAILFMVFGMLQRDGYFIVAGYTAIGLTVVYLGGLAALTVLGGQALLY